VNRWLPMHRKSEGESKFKNKKVVDGELKFDSQKEYKRYKELKLLEQSGSITDLKLQETFELQPKFKKNGVSYRAICYVADFSYYDTTINCKIVEDVKGMKTDVFKLKQKMFEYVYPELKLIII